MLDYAAFPEQRQALIYQILQENGRVICSELASRLGVSEHTIRRDLHELSKDGVCKKSMAARSLHSLNPKTSPCARVLMWRKRAISRRDAPGWSNPEAAFLSTQAVLIWRWLKPYPPSWR